MSCLREKPHFDKMFIFADYEGMIQTAVYLMKFEKIKRLARPLADLLLSLDLPVVDAIIPVPLSKKRLTQRGFNQSHLLGRYISKNLSVPLKCDLLVKTKDTPPQSMLSREERIRNPKRAFSVAGSSREVPQTVLLVDDVMTTGATMNACARILKKAGTRMVYGSVLARTQQD
jgi:ComF family protein